MAYVKVFVQAFSMFFILAVSSADPIGFNWGRQTSQKILPSMVVDILMSNNITKAKIFSSPDAVLQAFTGTNIELMVAIPNNEFPLYTTLENATFFVKNILGPYVNSCSIRSIAIGNEPFSPAINDANDTYMRSALPVMQNVQKALEDANLDKTIKLSIPHFTDILKDMPGITKPSDADFVDSIKQSNILPSIQFQQQHGSFFMIDMNLAYIVKKQSLPVEAAFFEGESNFTIQDNNLTYTNLFDVVYDSFVWALKKNGFPNMKVVVAQVGWPTDAYPQANVINAKRFYDGFLKKMGKNTGTPLRPGPMQVYLYNLIDENRVSINRGTFQRHWGIYMYDGTPKFPIDLTGQGQDKWPAKAQGVVYMPKRWCVFNGDRSDRYKVDLWSYIACNRSDCTNFAEGGSCNFLSADQKVSYGFNMWYQMTSQFIMDATACNYGGLGIVTTIDPSVGNCTFPVQILTSKQEVFTVGDATPISALNSVAFQFIFLAIHWIIVMR